MVARLTAKGHKPPEIAAMINRTPATIRNWLAAPAMAELVAQYFGEEEIRITGELELRHEQTRRIASKAKDEAERRLDDDPENIPWSQLLKLMADADDRTGLARQETKVNLNMNIGAKLDKAVERSRAAKLEAPDTTNVVKLRRV